MRNLLLSAVVGDIAGSSYEFHPCREYDAIELPKDQSSFTDDTVCTIAVADALIHGNDLAQTMKRWCRDYPERGYGGRFACWFHCDWDEPYESYGNGSAMRVSAVAFFARSEEECLMLAKWSAEITHNHPEGVRGAQAAALATYLLLHGGDKKDVQQKVLNHFYPDFELHPVDKLKIGYEYNETCQGSVPQSIACFLESESYEDCIRLCISMGGDADTMCAIAGPMAYAFFGEMPKIWVDQALTLLPEDMIKIIEEFDNIIASKRRIPVKAHTNGEALRIKQRISPDKIITLQKNEVFVFGSNLAGMHRGGAASIAHRNFGAEWGVGVGMTGQCYAIPTMHGGVNAIRPYTDQFIEYAENHPEKTFLVTRIGCGIAGFQDSDIAPLFANALTLENVYLPKSFLQILTTENRQKLNNLTANLLSKFDKK